MAFVSSSLLTSCKRIYHVYNFFLNIFVETIIIKSTFASKNSSKRKQLHEKQKVEINVIGEQQRCHANYAWLRQTTTF